MQQSSIDFLRQHRHIYEHWQQTGEVRTGVHNFWHPLVDIVRKEFYAGYQCCMWCSGDLVTLLNYAYTQFLKHEQENSSNPGNIQ